MPSILSAEDSWESLGLRGDQPTHPNGNPSWIFIGNTGAEAETPILWPPDEKNWLPIISPKPIRQIIGSYIQSNECRHNVTYSVHQTHSNFLTDKRQNCIYGTPA